MLFTKKELEVLSKYAGVDINYINLSPLAEEVTDFDVLTGVYLKVQKILASKEQDFPLPGLAMLPDRYKLMWISEHNALVVIYALMRRLKEVRSEVEILKLAATRDLKLVERMMLPSNLQKMSHEQLKEQVDPWISLQMGIEGLIETFTFELIFELKA
jgi:hypothetical protein